MLANLMSFFIVHLYCIFKSKIELNELVTKGNLMNYHHFTIDERESILIYRTKGLNFSQRGKIPISHTIHERPREANKRTRIGDWEADHHLSNTVKHLFLDCQWSPEACCA